MHQPLDLSKLVETLRSVYPGGTTEARLHEPEFRGHERDYVRECLDSGWVSSAGPFVERFEAELAAYAGVKRAVAVVNGTAALHTCLMVVGVERGDEVIIPTLTFVATANAVRYCGAVPHFADASEETLGLDPVKLSDHIERSFHCNDGQWRNRRTGRRLGAIMPVHTYGHPVDLDPLLALCARLEIPLIEDAAESIGSLYRGRHTGGFGLVGALSFNGNKTLTTGGGGALLTNDEDLADRAKHLTTTARVGQGWSFRHDAVGYNYRMPNLNAALGCAQLEVLPGVIERKRRLAQQYRDALGDIEGLRLFVEPGFARSNYWLNVLLVDADRGDQRQALLEATNAAGLMTRPAWVLMHQLPMFEACPRMDLSVAEGLERRLINLPSSAALAN